MFGPRPAGNRGDSAGGGGREGKISTQQNSKNLSFFYPINCTLLEGGRVAVVQSLLKGGFRLKYYLSIVRG